MKKLYALSICALMSFSIVGCSDNKQELKDQVKEEAKQAAEEKKKQEEAKQAVVDEAFLESMKTGLQNRWDKVSVNKNKTFNSHYGEYIQAELDEIEGFEDKKFNDSKMKEVAVAYINALKNQLKAAKNADKDLANANFDFSGKAMRERISNLKTLVNDYGLEVDKEHQDDLKEILSIIDDDDWNDYGIFDDMKIKEVESDAMNRTLQLSGVNGSDTTFNNIYFEIQIETRDGEILTTVAANPIKSIRPGQKYNVVFYLPTEQSYPDVKDMLIQVYYNSYE